MLNNIRLSEINGGINLIDLGASGRLDYYWSSIQKFLNLYAFDPNKEECERLSDTSNNFISATYIPCAIAGEKGEFTLYKTKSIYCWSLLEPDMDWQSRFSYCDLFAVESTSKIEALSLEDVEELRGIDIDAIKLDTQGLELPILEGAHSKVNDAFLIETETGFVENYKGESTFYQISKFMEENNFLLFDINTNHRISRKNKFSDKTSNQQILWCEATWLKDYVTIDKKDGLQIDRAKALKALILCANHGCIDYGLELAILFFEKKLITEVELNLVKQKRTWLLHEKMSFKSKTRQYLKNILNFIPNKYSKELGNILFEVSQNPNPIRKLFRKVL